MIRKNKFGLYVFGLIVALFSMSGVNANDKPNILLIIADDMGLDASNCYDVGNQQASMPLLEALCREGMVFENMYAAPVCTPTRATIMTGRYGFRTGIQGLIDRRNGKGLSADEVSLFDVVKDEGYASAIIGKWHLAGQSDGLTHPQTLGVDEYYGIYQGGVRDYESWEGVHNGQRFTSPTYTTTDFTNKAIEWIGAQDKPWFLWLAHNAPHTPFHLPPAELHTASQLSDDAQSIRRNPVAYYNAALQALDQETARLLSSLSAEDQENTIILFIGDNGSPGRIANGLYGRQRAKGSVFEGGTHVPFIAYGPGISQGRNSSLLNSTDLFATIAELTGSTSKAEDSISIVPLFKGASGERTHAFVERVTTNTRRNARSGWAIRDVRYKLVVLEGQDKMLFDLQNDPFENNDLLASGDAIARQKADELQAARDALN